MLAVTARRQTEREVGIDQGHLRQHQRTAKARLDAVLGRTENGVAGDLGAGARRSRNRDERQGRNRERLRTPDHFEVVQHFAGIRGERRDRLSGIDGAAAAEPDHDIAAALAQLGHALLDTIDGRFASPWGTQRVSSPESAPAQRDGSAPVTTNARDPNDRAMPGSCAAVPGPNTMRAAVANSNCTLPALVRRKTLGYFTLERGSAIIPATVSRHFA